MQIANCMKAFGSWKQIKLSINQYLILQTSEIQQNMQNMQDTNETGNK